jgi:hypothetical protein
VKLTDAQRAALPEFWHPLREVYFATNKPLPQFIMAKRIGGLASLFVAWWNEDAHGIGAGTWNADRCIIDIDEGMAKRILESFDSPGMDPHSWFDRGETKD